MSPILSVTSIVIIIKAIITKVMSPILSVISIVIISKVVISIDVVSKNETKPEI